MIRSGWTYAVGGQVGSEQSEQAAWKKGHLNLPLKTQTRGNGRFALSAVIHCFPSEHAGPLKVAFERAGLASSCTGSVPLSLFFCCFGFCSRFQTASSIWHIAAWECTEYWEMGGFQEGSGRGAERPCPPAVLQWSPALRAAVCGVRRTCV